MRPAPSLRPIPVPEDLDLARRSVLDDGTLVECGPLSTGAQAFDAGLANGRVAGDLGARCEARSDRSILVDGSVSGAPDYPCLVKAQQQVVVSGNAAHAQITAGSIHVAGDVSGCRLVASTAVHVGGDLSACEVTIGGFDDQRHTLEVLQTQASRVAHEHQLQSQRLAIDERRVGRLVQATRVSCEVQLGQLIRTVGDRVQVDLQAFYRVVGPRSPEALDAALVDFFNRAVSGRMALANRNYLRSNPAAQKVFIRVLAALQQLFVSTRQADTAATRQRELREQIHQAARALRDRPLSLHLSGAVVPDLQLTFVVPDLIVQADGSLVLAASSTHLQVAADRDPGNLLVKQVGANGAERELTAPCDELRAVSFWRDQGVVDWRPLPEVDR